MSKIAQLTPVQYKIIKELYNYVERTTNNIDVLAALGSWGDTLDEEDVLCILESCNK